LAKKNKNVLMAIIKEYSDNGLPNGQIAKMLDLKPK